MKVEVRYFAQVREALGTGESLSWADDAPDCPRTVGQLRSWLIARSARHAEALDLSIPLRAACNQFMCHADEALPDGAEVAFFPPVTGG
ncbi:MoaD/ThiS family protein [Aquabacterium sp.]|uniref:MoaD/ThiS family protein n=1 Tax=Aquabacterium sp. TaxID=1872578 RepID=UPI0035B1BBA3